MAYTTINKPSDYFNTKLYTGTGSAGQAQTGVGFQPDLVWTKSRSNTYPHQWYDVIRGVTKRLQSNDTSAEATQSNGLTSFDSDGFTVGDASGTGVNNATYASWNWKANGAGSANTDGSISSTVSANTTSGFSIVTYSGTGSAGTVGHGLGVAPSMIIVKVRTGRTASWLVYHKGIASDAQTDFIKLESTDAAADEATIWNDTAPTSSVFSVGTEDTVSGSGNTFVAYCFAEKKGYSKFGSYTGNGNADGVFVYTGFKPAYVTIKRSSNTSDWHHFDNKRAGFNGDNDYLKLNGSDSEGTSGDRIDFLSNGFKLRYATGNLNETGDTFIYNAFAEAPLVGSNGVTAKAR